jgi:uncharacterized protein (UPF0335 family)
MPRVNGVDGSALGNYVARLNRIKEVVDARRQDMRAVYDQAERAGFNRAALRRLFNRSLMTPEERGERDLLDATYERACGFEQLELDLGTIMARDHEKAETMPKAKTKAKGKGASPKKSGKRKSTRKPRPAESTTGETQDASGSVH